MWVCKCKWGVGARSEIFVYTKNEFDTESGSVHTELFESVQLLRTKSAFSMVFFKDLRF